MKRKIFIAAMCAVLVLAIRGGIFWYYHPTHYKFNDRFVIGNTKDEIIERYGNPYSSDEISITYMIKDNTPDLVMSYDDSLWYVIVFKDGVADRVYLREGYLGG